MQPLALYARGMLIDLMPGQTSFASGTGAINDLGQVAGGFDASGVTHAFLYADGRATDEPQGAILRIEPAQ